MYAPINATPIDELYEQEDKQRSNTNVKKFIRNGSNIAQESGMMSSSYKSQSGMQGQSPMNNQRPPNGYVQSPMNNNNNSPNNLNQTIQNHIMAHSRQPQPQYAPREYFEAAKSPSPIINPSLNCLDVCKHIESCPICSKFFDTDKTLFIFIIIALLIIIGFLVKKLIDSK